LLLLELLSETLLLTYPARVVAALMLLLWGPKKLPMFGFQRLLLLLLLQLV
jgi:hypothetical protein